MANRRSLALTVESVTDAGEDTIALNVGGELPRLFLPSAFAADADPTADRLKKIEDIKSGDLILVHHLLDK